MFILRRTTRRLLQKKNIVYVVIFEIKFLILFCDCYFFWEWLKACEGIRPNSYSVRTFAKLLLSAINYSFLGTYRHVVIKKKKRACSLLGTQSQGMWCITSLPFPSWLLHSSKRLFLSDNGYSHLLTRSLVIHCFNDPFFVQSVLSWYTSCDNLSLW